MGEHRLHLVETGAVMAKKVGARKGVGIGKEPSRNEGGHFGEAKLQAIIFGSLSAT